MYIINHVKTRDQKIIDVNRMNTVLTYEQNEQIHRYILALVPIVTVYIICQYTKSTRICDLCELCSADHISISNDQ